MSKTVEISRDQLARIKDELVRGNGVSRACAAEELRELLAAPVVERQEVIDLDAVDWETIQQAADESNWMPNEYMRNEWVADVCNFLKYGRADISPPAPIAESKVVTISDEAGRLKRVSGDWCEKCDSVTAHETRCIECWPDRSAPVKVVLPDRIDPPSDYAYRKGWNACLDKIKELNK